MSKFPRPAVFAALGALLLCTACMKQESKTTVMKDGSGTTSFTMTNDLAAIAQLRAMVALFAGNAGGPGGADPAGDPAASEPFLDLDFFVHDKVDGIQWTQKKEETKDGKQTIHLEASFSDWSLLGKANLVFGASSLAKNEDGSWTWSLDVSMGMGSMLPGAGGGAGMGGDMPPEMAAYLPMLEPLLGTLEVSQTLTLPGKVVETNGTKSEDGSTVSWKVGFKDVLAGKNTMKVTFRGEGLALKPFESKPDAKRMQDRLLKPRPKPPPAVTPSTPDGAKPPEPKPGEEKPGDAKPGDGKPADPK